MRIGCRVRQNHLAEQQRFNDHNRVTREMDHFAECIRANR